MAMNYLAVYFVSRNVPTFHKMKIEQEDKNLIKAKGKHTLQTESQGENANILTKNVAFSKQIIFSEKLFGPFNAESHGIDSKCLMDSVMPPPAYCCNK